MLPRAAFAIFLAAVCRASAQEACTDALPAPPSAIAQPLPSSAWLDLRQTMSRNSKSQEAPAWVEALTLLPGELTEGGGASKSIFRIRVTQPGPDYRILFFRLFFDDKPNQQPELVAWDESGSHILRSGTLGAGMNLPSSDSVLIPMTGASAIDIEVPGDGKTIRAAYLDWMTSSEVVHPVNVEHRDIIAEPFSVVPALHAPPVEIANSRIDVPPEVYVNDHNIGPAALSLPDLADPGYRGEQEPLTTEMHFNYTGWLRAQKIVPASILKVGANDLVITNGAGTGASAIRATQVQLKYIWDKSDYLLRTGN